MSPIVRTLFWSVGWILILGCASSPAAPESGSSSGAVLTWTRDGGIAGFCDRLEVTGGGGVTTSSCRSSSTKSGQLPADDLAQLNRWLEAFSQEAIESSDGRAADAMTLKLTLAGRGGGHPSDAQKQEMLDWAQRVYADTSR